MRESLTHCHSECEHGSLERTQTSIEACQTDRLLELLEPLWREGFRYLALETIASWDPINERGYPILWSGFYSNDMVHAQMIRTAISMGYRIVAYEEEPDQYAQDQDDLSKTLGRATAREYRQASNIVSRIFDIDKNAKVLVHCGYGHASERKTKSFTPMAHFLRELTGLNPLTIDQTLFSERSRSDYEHPWRVEAMSRGLLGKGDEPMVLLDADANPVRRGGMDIFVFGNKTQYQGGRPIWMNMGGRRQAVWVDTLECREQSCMVEAVHEEESEDAVPYDRIEADHTERILLYLPPDVPIRVQIMNLDQKLLGSRKIHLKADSSIRQD